MNEILKYSFSLVAGAIVMALVAVSLGAPTQVLTGMPPL
jgi:hypothetical protein